jgi:alpha-galactosidase
MSRVRMSLCALVAVVACARAAEPAARGPVATSAGPDEVLTPAAPRAPRINGASVFGVRPGSPVLHAIAATGERPMSFQADGLPDGVRCDAKSGRITGVTTARGEHRVILRASNAAGVAERVLRLVVGDRIALTPPMGWNSWNCWADAVDQDKVMRSARQMVASGLTQHGWVYVNIDDTWQGERGGEFHAIQGNEKFPRLKELCDELHAMGLKAGIYSTPWITTYGKYRGGSSDDPGGEWTRALGTEAYWRHGKHSFAAQDARQFEAWGFDYLKYDWSPNDVAHTEEMAKALRAARRDIVFSLSNSAPREHAAEWARLANCWRTTGDILDQWENAASDWQFGVSDIGFAQDAWASHAGPGHWNDPDMLVLGWVGWGPKLHRTRLTSHEQYSHMSLWCLLGAPLLIGCDLERLDAFTLGLLTNDEVLAVNQDALGRQAIRIASAGAVDVFAKELEDGSHAVGFFNRAGDERTLVFNKLPRVGFKGTHRVRDLWRQQDLGLATNGCVTARLAPHGVVLLKLTRVE